MKENGEVVFDGVVYKDVYMPLVDEKGKTIGPNSERRPSQHPSIFRRRPEPALGGG